MIWLYNFLDYAQHLKIARPNYRSCFVIFLVVLILSITFDITINDPSFLIIVGCTMDGYIAISIHYGGSL